MRRHREPARKTRNVTTRDAFVGFTIVEALLALTLASIAGAAILLSVDSGVQMARSNVERTVALGLARQLMDEIVGSRYFEGSDPKQWPLCANGSELAAGNRELFDDIDDYAGYTECPPKSPLGVRLGTDKTGGEGQAAGSTRDSYFFAPSGFLTRWRRTADVYYVSDADPSQQLTSGSTSYHRAVEVRVWYDDPVRGSRELAKLRCVIAYVPQ